MLQRAVAMLESLAATSPSNAGYLGYLGTAAATAGERFADSGKYERALVFYRKALATFQQLTTGDPDNGDARLGMAGTYTKMGTAFAKLREPSQALDSYTKALALCEPLASGKSPNQSALYTVADTYFGLGDLSAAVASSSNQSATTVRDAWMRAREMYSKSVQAWRTIQNPAKLTPNGFDAGDPNLASGKLARSEAVLAKLTQSAQSRNVMDK